MVWAAQLFKLPGYRDCDANRLADDTQPASSKARNAFSPGLQPHERNVVMTLTIKRKVLKPIKQHIRKAGYFALDTLDYVLGRRDDLTPPKRMVTAIGGGDFKAVGQELLTYFIELGDLQPTDRVLEVGCGAGRVAVPLTTYLNAQGGYEGFDIDGEAIRWCQTHITRRYPHFRFQLAEVHNRAYNPTGYYPASAYRFPYVDASFDFVFLGSVFTHMLSKDMQNYLSEISRVLKTGKKCLITFFLHNLESSQLMAAGSSTLDFAFEHEGVRVNTKHLPEAAVAYAEA